MSRWINADALINDLEHDIAIDLDILNYVGTEGAERTNAQFDKDCKQNAIELLLRQPSIDLVRCAECRHCTLDIVVQRREDGYERAINLCRCPKHKEEWSVDKNWFCADGEREGE